MKYITYCFTSSLLLSLAGCSQIKTEKPVKPQERNSMKIDSKYTPLESIKPSRLTGVSDAQIDDHWKLYVGYVNNVNQLNAELKELIQDPKSNPLVIADRRRRYGFEYNGMILHEYYFGNLTTGSNPLEANSKLKKALEETWGSFEAWQQDFINTGKSRGIGWAVLYMDPTTNRLTNHFIMDHENGPIAGFTPILVMDVWEHAYMVDHKAGGRADYITAFLKNTNWNEVERRYKQVAH